MTTVLAVALGLILMYLILSLVASAVNEGFASLTDRRAEFLEKGVRNLLGPELARDFYRHGLIGGLTRKGVRFHARPSYISSSTFGTVLLDLVANEEGSSEQEPPDMTKVRARVAAIDAPGTKDLKEALSALANETDGWTDLKRRIEGWFNEAMDRVSGWYRRRTRVVLWIIALTLVGVLNADTVNVARVLWLDPTVRTAAEAAAREAVQEEAPAQPSGEDPVELARDAAGAIQRLEEVGLPLRWSAQTTPDDVPGWLLKFVGLLITAFALTFGAAFWFDLLKKLVGVRSSGPPPPPPPPEAAPEKK